MSKLNKSVTALNATLGFINFIFFAAVIWLDIGKINLNNIDQSALTNVLLTCVTVILTGIAILIAILTIIGFKTIIDAAEKKAGDIADIQAKEYVEKLAAPIIENLIKKEAESLAQNLKDHGESIAEIKKIFDGFNVPSKEPVSNKLQAEPIKRKGKRLETVCD